MNEDSVREFTLIEAMRFPLICLVVFVHSAGAFPTETLEWSLDGWNIYHFVSEMISRHFCSIATCWFFVLSGYLFFRSLKEGEFGFDWMISKWKNRARSLLLPYLIWNLLAVAAIIFKNAVIETLSISGSADDYETVLKGPWYWLFTGPADFPLWFLRDLILLSLLAPGLFLFFKKFKWISLVLLTTFYLSPLDPGIPSMRSIFFFGIGIWLSAHRIYLTSLCGKYRVPSAILATLLLLGATSQVGRPSHGLLLNLFHPFGMICFLNLMNAILDDKKSCDCLCILSGSVFFIYAIHEIYILGWTKGLCLRIFGDSLGAHWLGYFLVPILVLAICLSLYWAMSRFFPKTLAFICGGRSRLSIRSLN